MAYAHGVTVNEQTRSVLAPTQLASAIPVVIGTAPINLSKSAVLPVNVPILANTFAEAVAALGYSEDFASYSLCEVMDSHFRHFGLAPVVFINVLDPAEHKTTVVPASVPITAGVLKLTVNGVLLGTVVVKSSDGTTTYVKDTDYTAAFDENGQVLITRKTTGAIPANATALQVGYDKLNPVAVDASDIIGGVDAGTGKKTGLELINEVFPRFGLVPSLLLAPGYSIDPTVAAVMVAKAVDINGHFKALALTDIPTGVGGVKVFTDALAWKADNNYDSAQQIPLWPKVVSGGKQYHLSTRLAGAIGSTDAAYGGIPFASPSNKDLKIDGAVLADGSEVYLGPDQAASLNAQGIATALNFVGGWKSWGNHTGAFPGSAEPKEAYIAVRRMFDWVSNSIVLTYWSKVDDPMSKRLIEAVTDSLNIWLNGLTASGALLGGRVEFNATENSEADLLAGKLRFHVYLTPPSPAQEINFTLEYDPSYLGSLVA
ncbi:phage tail sheath family protein [Paenibacillus harenae]|uniref:Phage tail sheath protein FI n=1 Tax=Paenibacillus harenae TaxID=306543 RepID=A0ABT9U3Z9_PAEHA|nr:phage tail sheath C-terminal domain-containing protein [Paenibacillus harenae]MDQ0114358.1 phage tail sheath protein FI [Paenibacillus harenae]